MADVGQVLATGATTIVGVAVGAGLTYWFGVLNRRHQEAREDKTRWYEQRLRAYIEFSTAAFDGFVLSVPAIVLLALLLAGCGQIRTSDKPTGPPKVLYQQTGSGSTTTPRFKVPDDWALVWAYDCSGHQIEGNFIVDFNGFDGFLNPVNQLGVKNNGVENLHHGGKGYLEVISECSWSFQAMT